MRKEVKLGMFIGGGLVALLVVYLLVAPPSNNKKGAHLADGSGGGTNIADLTAPGDVPADNAAAPTPKPAEGAVGAPATPETRTNTAETAKPAPKSDVTAKKTGDWTMLENGGEAKAGKVGTPQVASASKETIKAPERSEKQEKVALGSAEQSPKLYFNPNDAWGGGLSTDGIPSVRNVKGNLTTIAGEPKASAPVAGGTHIVRSGETFSSIAQSAYGSAAFYPAILRANPTVNPNNLKPGTQITLPKLDEVKGSGGATASTAEHAGAPTSAAAAQSDVKIDQAKQYKVQSGDSLYKISLKLYGKSSYVDRIYEANKQTIGSDPKKLKLGMILNLPERPATPLASPADGTTSTLSEGPNFADDQAK
jgi:nucleoid-associated protein YgaU